MRRPLGKPKRVRAGDTVRIRVKLARRSDLARLYVWSAVGDFDLAPHIPPRMAGLMENGRPMMVQPMSVRLSEHRRDHVISFVADEDMRVCVMEELDVPGPATARARISAHGEAFENFVERLRNLFRFAWRRDAAGHAGS